MAAAKGLQSDHGKIAILALSAGGLELGKHLAAHLPAELHPCKGQLRERFHTLWQSHDALICIMASGVVVRCIAPFLQDKHQDPAVLVLDERGQFVISLLSGHVGGANALSQRVANLTGGQAVITTASDVLGLTALDLWCASLGLQVADKKQFTRAMGRLVDQGFLHLWSEPAPPPLPPDIRLSTRQETADLLISFRQLPHSQSQAALLHPRALAIGIGCNRGTSRKDIAEAVSATLAQHKLAPQSVARLASIDLKADEPGLLAYSAEKELPLEFFSKDQLNQVEDIQYSEAAFRATGARGVAEPAALLAAGPGARLLVPKIKWPNVTVAVASVNSVAWPSPASK
ncbi:MAG: cobalamin biosynthesis protein CbiG [Desulfobulbaceae bacterium]|nr:cobalamin biosynthesis protein CbiG [Desulfobulbaceae bacterium]